MRFVFWIIYTDELKSRVNDSCYYDSSPTLRGCFQLREGRLGSGTGQEGGKTICKA